MFDAPGLAEFLVNANLGVTLPAVSLVIGTCVLLLVDLFIPKERKTLTAWLAAAGLAVSFSINLLVYSPENSVAFDGMFLAGSFTGFLNIVVLLTALISILLSVDYLKRAQIERGEFYSLLLLSVSGIMFMISANDLLVVFIGLELLSIPLYILTAFRVDNNKSQEGGMKYFILGAFASAFFVYGAALVYGATGTTNLNGIFAAVGGIVTGQEGQTVSLLLLVGASFILAGLGFKIAVVPFHMWTPDVYEGAPTPVTAFMSVGAKIGGFAALLRIVAVALATFQVGTGDVAVWQQTVWLIAAITLILGNFVAIVQVNIKRLLAYSSISHAGYILMAVAAAGTPGYSDEAVRAALVYLLAYMFTNLGAFAVALAVEKDDGSGTDLEDFVGLSRSRPVIALMMAFFMLSLTGIPLTGGFIGKLLVFKVTLDSGLVPLAIIGVLTSLVSAFYYVRIIVNMYLREGDGAPALGATRLVNWAIYAAFAGTLLVGILPPLVTNLTDMVTLATRLP